MVSNTWLSCQGEKTGSKDSTNNTFVENPIVVPISAGTSKGLPLEDTSTTKPRINAIGAGFSDATRSAPTGRLAHPRGNPILHKEFLHRLHTSCLHHGETNPTPNMVPLFLDGLAGVNRGVEILLLDL